MQRRDVREGRSVRAKSGVRTPGRKIATSSRRLARAGAARAKLSGRDPLLQATAAAAEACMQAGRRQSGLRGLLSTRRRRERARAPLPTPRREPRHVRGPDVAAHAYTGSEGQAVAHPRRVPRAWRLLAQSATANTDRRMYRTGGLERAYTGATTRWPRDAYARTQYASNAGLMRKSPPPASQMETGSKSLELEPPLARGLARASLASL
eukprot:6198455-Pleurochrysis_carterae.AAC.1